MTPSRLRGFTLTELAVVLTIVGLLLLSLMYTLSAQTEQRNFEETRRRLEAARELLLGFAIAHGRLPCPASSTSAGDEAPLGGGACTVFPNHNGLLPARTIGFQIVDAEGYAVDAWNNRLRYAVVNSPLAACAAASTTPHFTDAATLKANGMTCLPNELVVCKSATAITATTCGPALNALTNQTAVVTLVFSLGKNGSAGAGGIDEAANLNGDAVFVWHTPTPAAAGNGEFDDQMHWITVGELYGKLIAAGVLP